MYQRIVCFKYKPDVDAEMIMKHMREFRKLKDIIPEIKSYSAGLAVPQDDGSMPDFDSMHYLTFASLEDISSYFLHDDHQRLRVLNRQLSDRIFVMTTEISVLKVFVT